MKAYIGWIDEDDDGFKEIVFGNTATEAKKELSSTDMCLDAEWIDLRVRRCIQLDDKEKLSRRELSNICWRKLGWSWYDFLTPDPDDTTDEEFYKWYDDNFGKDDDVTNT